MEREYAYFLHLMGAFIREEPPRREENLSWDTLMELARVHSLSGVLGYLIMSYDLCPTLSAAARQLCMSTISAFTQRDALTRRFSQALSRQGIDHILMKGYVVKDCYPLPQLRTYGDIDLVIRPEDRPRCHDYMLSQGFRVKTDWEPVYSYLRGTELYELHTQLLDTDIPGKPRLRDWFSAPWDNVLPADGHSFRFRTEYHFLYLIAHLAKHVQGAGAGVRMYMDIALYLRRHTDMDWDALGRDLTDMGLYDFAVTVLAFGEVYFGVRSPLGGNVPREWLEELGACTLSGGIFGREGQDSGTLILRAQKPDASAAGTVLRRLFPRAKSIESRYTYLQKRPWLLPVAWVHRLFKTRRHWRDHTREARDICRADRAQVRRAQTLLRDIGLGESGDAPVRKRVVEPEEFVPDYLDILRQEPAVTELPLVVSGGSMRPFLIPGRDTVYLSRVERPLRRGDIVLYRRACGRYVLHRIQKITPGGLTMIGDGQRLTEPGIQPEQVLAMATRVRRKGRELTPKSFWWKFFARFWLRIIPLRRPILTLYTALSRLLPRP